MKGYAKILLLAIAGISLSAGLLHAAKPSLSNAKAKTTVGKLLKVIKTASPLADFFVYNTKQRRYTSPSAAGITLDLNAPVGGLQQDPDQINAIKTAYRNSPTLKRNRKTLERTLAWVDQYAKYLLYFNYNGNKVYINNPWPQATPTAVYNIIQKWAP